MTPEELAEQKQALRQQVRARLAAMTPQARAHASAQACARLREQPAWHQAKSIFFYFPLPQEVDLWPLAMEARDLGKTILLPRYVAAHGHYEACQVSDPARDCVPGKYGILEPTAPCQAHPLNRLDLLLVPGVAFDFCGHRLGRGRGFYDRLLAQASGIRCGVAFEEQLTESVPVEPHDVSLNCLLTPARWFTVSGTGVSSRV